MVNINTKCSITGLSDCESGVQWQGFFQLQRIGLFVKGRT
jgi:hypothetical protein